MNNQVQTPKTSDAASSNPAVSAVQTLPVDHAGEIPCPPCRRGVGDQQTVNPS